MGHLFCHTSNALSSKIVCSEKRFIIAQLLSFKFWTVVNPWSGFDRITLKKNKTLARADKNLFASSAATSQKKSTNGLLVSHALRIQRVLLLHRHHAEHCSNLRDQKDFVFAKKFKNIASESGCFWSRCWFTSSANVCCIYHGLSTK